MAIFLSLGISKLTIFGQFLIELLGHNKFEKEIEVENEHLINQMIEIVKLIQERQQEAVKEVGELVASLKQALLD